MAIEQAHDDFARDIHHSTSAFWEALNPLPSPAKSVILLLARVTCYAFGAAAAFIVGGLLAATLTALGAGAFIALTANILVCVLGSMAAWRFSDQAIDFVASGGVSRSIDTAKGWLDEKLGRVIDVVPRTVH
jgi:hypothetical protein